MVPYETYQSNAAELPVLRQWVWRALVISLLLHAGLLIFFHFKLLENFGTSVTERLAPPVPMPRSFHLADLPDSESSPVIPDHHPVAQKIVIPKEPPTVGDIQVAPRVAQDAPAQMAPKMPKPEFNGEGPLANSPGNSVSALEQQWRTTAGPLLDTGEKSPLQPTIRVSKGDQTGTGASGNSAGIPGRTWLNQALAEAGGPISGGPIAMHGGALFEWGKADLRPEAIEDLQKLGLLIQHNPQATFIISGHTDHTGTHEANLILSQQRADAVRDWLVANLGIDPARITTIGKADNDAFPDLGPDKSVEEQAPNRRVEIVIKTHRK